MPSMEVATDCAGRVNVEVELYHLNVLDLPDEILLIVFKCLAGKFIPPPGQSDRDGWQKPKNGIELKSVRLSCQRFYNISSPLFINTVQVDSSAPSLSRFVQISKHPLVSRGVRAVVFGLWTYDSVLASGLDAFTSYNIRRMSEDIAYVRNPSLRRSDLDRHHDRDRRDLEHIDKIESVLEDWRAITNGADSLDSWPSSETPRNHRILRQNFIEYRRLFMGQETIRKDGTLYTEIAQGLTRMPVATLLSFQDEHPQFQRLPLDMDRYSDIPLDYESELLAFLQTTLLPISWREADKYDLGIPSTTASFDLLSAISRENCYIKDLRMNFCLPHRLNSLLPDQYDSEILKGALGHLKTFHINIRSDDFYPRPRKAWKTLLRFLRALLDTPSLVEVHIDMSQLYTDLIGGLPKVSCGSLLTTNPWPNLKNLKLNWFSISLPELKRFVKWHIDTPSLSIEAFMIDLRQASWAEALDILRMLRHRAKLLKLASPRGEDVDDMPDDLWRSVFRWKGHADDDVVVEPSLAELYMRGLIESNPLRDFAEQSDSMDINVNGGDDSDTNEDGMSESSSGGDDDV